MGRESTNVTRLPERRTSLTAYAVALWRRPDVEATCLELQDQHGQSPPLILWRLWTLAQKRPADVAVIEAAAAATRRWDEVAIRPLREVRRRLSEPLPPFSTPARERIRSEVRVAELNAELALLEVLESLTLEPDETPVESLSALLELAAIWGANAPMALLRRLVEAAA